MRQAGEEAQAGLQLQEQDIQPFLKAKNSFLGINLIKGSAGISFKLPESVSLGAGF
jgi:hypothetical protein